MNKIKSFIQKVRIELYILGSFIMTIIAFSTNYYFVKAGGIRNGVSIFESYVGAEIGWLFFILILFGFLTTIYFISVDNLYSKRAKLSFLSTIGFTAFIFILLVLWVLIDNDYIIGTKGFLRGGFGFAFYWFIIHLLLSGFIAYFYHEYTGPGEKTVYNWLNAKGVCCNFKSFGNSTLKKYQELEKAKELLDKGILTEEEYLNEKKDIMDKYKTNQKV